MEVGRHKEILYDLSSVLKEYDSVRFSCTSEDVFPDLTSSAENYNESGVIFSATYWSPNGYTKELKFRAKEDTTKKDIEKLVAIWVNQFVK